MPLSPSEGPRMGRGRSKRLALGIGRLVAPFKLRPTELLRKLGF